MPDTYPGVLDGHEGHTPKSRCPLLYASHSFSRGNLKNLTPRSFTFCVPALLLQFQIPSTIITKRCVLRWTLAKPWVPTVWP